MHYLNNTVTSAMNFYQNTTPWDLIQQYGSPLYVYNEGIFRTRLRELKNLVSYENFAVNYSAKANSNIALLQIAKQEGMLVDAMSPGEIYAELKAGFKPADIFYISNNVSKEEMQYAIDQNITTSVDSVSQLIQYGQLNPGGKVAIRFNPGIGAGHHEKVVTAGKKTKFGVDPVFIPDVKNILAQYNLTLTGINQHIGSLFMEGDAYVESTKTLFDIAMEFDTLEFMDLGGGFGIPYQKQNGQARLDMKALGKRLDEVIKGFISRYGKNITFKIEPGRYAPAEASVLLGVVHAVKTNHGQKYIGCDLGFNVLIRPAMYDSHHDIEVYAQEKTDAKETVTVVGNICESGDIIARDRLLPAVKEGDILGVLDAGAYGHVMSSNYNNRLRPAEVLLRENGDTVLIRERDTFEDLIQRQKMIVL